MHSTHSERGQIINSKQISFWAPTEFLSGCLEYHVKKDTKASASSDSLYSNLCFGTNYLCDLLLQFPYMKTQIILVVTRFAEIIKKGYYRKNLLWCLARGKISINISNCHGSSIISMEYLPNQTCTLEGWNLMSLMWYMWEKSLFMYMSNLETYLEHNLFANWGMFVCIWGFVMVMSSMAQKNKSYVVQ